MASFERFEFRAWDLSVLAIKPADEIEMPHFIMTFNSTETFHDVVKRLARSQPERQVKLAYYALENEMGNRQK